METSIRFKHQEFAAVERRLLEDPSVESYALAFAREHVVGDLRILAVTDVRYPRDADYVRRGTYELKVSFDGFLRHCLEEAYERVDVDCVIDIHTHPFTEEAWFSETDDADERGFCTYLSERDLGYASIVLVRGNHAARYWSVSGHGKPVQYLADIKCQTALEGHDRQTQTRIAEVQDRSVRALGLKSMRRITGADWICVVGVGGIGSIVAEHLVHMGFSHIRLIDHDRLEISNMNRIVGATYADALEGRLKVDAVAAHLSAINPEASIEAMPMSVFDERSEMAIADSDWVIVATDNHASRLRVQELCFACFVPFITAGVNITVEDGAIRDMSGEVILVRMGDRVCLSCLGRVNYDAVARETHPDAQVRDGLVARGYVSGADVHEPAVKTLNTHLATLAVDVLVNQYTGRRRDSHVLVFEDNEGPCIYEDRAAYQMRNLNCAVCDI